MGDHTRIENRAVQDRHTAEIALMVTDKAGINAKASMTTGGLLAVAALVSSILLSTSILVYAASRGRKQRH